jgi:ankyrin repeat protein
MRFYNLSSGQTALLIVILAAVVVFTALYNRYIEITPTEKAIREGALPRLEELLAKRPDLVNKANRENGLSPLHWAVIGDKTNMAQLLLAKGADVNATDRYGWTPLHKAAAFNRLAIAEILMAKGADPRAFAIKYGLIRFAPIHLAAEAGFTGIVKLFLDNGIDINLRTKGTNQVTSLHISAAKGQAEVVEILLKAGADVNARDTEGKTPLFWAEKADQQEVADMLKIYDAIE